MSLFDNWATLSGFERDATFNNRAAFKDSEVLAAERNRRSAVFRNSNNAHLDIAYGEGERAKWDLYPAVGQAAPRNTRQKVCGTKINTV
jgi:arylformamidase